MLSRQRSWDRSAPCQRTRPDHAGAGVVVCKPATLCRPDRVRRHLRVNGSLAGAPGRDQAIAIARRFGVGVGMTGIAQAAAGPFRQFEPDPNPKIAPPPPDQWVWRVRLFGPISTSFVILDCHTGQYIETGIATP
jgi:hypothetical protein